MDDHERHRPIRSSNAIVTAALLLLFIGSGCSALIYELVWFQWLGLIIGVSAVSLGILLATFLGGMGLGAWLLPRRLALFRHPLTVYAGLEVFIGAYAALLALAMPTLARVYPGFAEPGLTAIALRATFAAVLLLPPTMCMGATLPVIARWVGRSRQGMARLGLFYGGNIAGAALGAVLAGFFLLRHFDALVATGVAVAINGGVGVLALMLARFIPLSAGKMPAGSPGAPTGVNPGQAGTALAAPAALGGVVLISGATALACQVIWTRHLSLFVGATVYGFALILAVFLVGLGIGTTIGSLLGRRLARPVLALAACQALLALAIAWAAFAVTQQLPYWPVNEALRLPADAVRAAWALLPATVLWGASFPLALAALPGRDESRAPTTGRTVGRLYALNTLGAIGGALGATLLGIPLLGSAATQQLLVAAAGLSALLALFLSGDGLRRRAIPAVVVLGVAVLAVRVVPPIPAQVIAAGHYLPDWGRGVDVIYAEEGVTASVAVSREPNGALTYHNSGKVQASSYPRDMRLQRMLGHLTTLLPERREDFLVIGLGAGVTAGALASDAAVKRITIAEIEPLVTRVAGTWFHDWNGGVTGDPRVEIVVEDGRHYLQHTDRRYDGITSDPLDPWTKGSAALYTEEFWRLAKSRLRPGGVVTAWGQLYESTEESARSVIATFMRAFPNSAIFANTVDQRGYDLVLVGMADGETLAVDRLIARVEGSASVGASLRRVDIEDGLDLLGTFAGRPADLAHWLEGAQINRDRDLRLQYLAGWGSKRYDQAAIFDAMLSRGVAFPRDWFQGEAGQLATLEALIDERQGRTH